MTAAPEWTADQLTEAVASALHDKDFEAIPPLITMLALRDPDRAQQVLDTINAGLAIGAARDK